jgi:hypothetical protein
MSLLRRVHAHTGRLLDRTGKRQLVCSTNKCLMTLENSQPVVCGTVDLQGTLSAGFLERRAEEIKEADGLPSALASVQ